MVRLIPLAAFGLLVFSSAATSFGSGLVGHPCGWVESPDVHVAYPPPGVVPPGTSMSVFTPVELSRYEHAMPACALRWDAHVTGTIDHRITQESAANLLTLPLPMDEAGPHAWDVELQRGYGSAQLTASYDVREDAPRIDLEQVSLRAEAVRTLAVRDEEGAWWGQLMVDGATVSDDDVLIVARRSGLWAGALLVGDQESASTPWFPILGPESFPICVDLLARGPTGNEVFLQTECAEPVVSDRSRGGCSSFPYQPSLWMWPAGAIAVLLVRRRRSKPWEKA